MAPRRAARDVSDAASAATAPASLRRTVRTASQSIRKTSPRTGGSSSSTSASAAASPPSSAVGRRRAAAAELPPAAAAGRRRRLAVPAPPGTRNVTSRQNMLILQAREQFNARERAGTALRSIPQNSPQIEPGRVLTEDEKLQREVQDLMADIGEDDRDPRYLKFLFNLDETMEEDSDDSDFDGEAGEEQKEDGEEVAESSSDSSDSDSETDSECDESMDDEAEDDDEEEEDSDDAASVTSFQAVMHRLMSGELEADDEDDYEPGEEEMEESSDDEEDEFVLLEEEENAAAKLEEEKLRKKEDREERENKTLLRTADYGACTLCAEDTVVDPVGCVHCANFIGCRKCSNRWYRSSKTNCDDHIAKCPLCRKFWPSDAPDVNEMAQLVKSN